MTDQFADPLLLYVGWFVCLFLDCLWSRPFCISDYFHKRDSTAAGFSSLISLVVFPSCNIQIFQKYYVELGESSFSTGVLKFYYFNSTCFSVEIDFTVLGFPCEEKTFVVKISSQLSFLNCCTTVMTCRIFCVLRLF